MSYDTTGPVKVSETKSLLVLILLILLVGGGVATALHLNKPQDSTTQAAIVAPADQTPYPPRPRPTGLRPRNPNRTPNQRPPDPPGDFLDWPSQNPSETQGTTALKSGAVYLNISLQLRNNRKIVDVWRSYALPERKPKTWSTVHFVDHVLTDPKLAQRYDATPEQLAELKTLDLKIPSLTAEQITTITDLFLAAESARRETAGAKSSSKQAATTSSTQPDPEKKAAIAKAALLKAAAKLTIPPTELDDLAEDAARAREILRPDQLDLIDSDFDRTLSNFDRPGYPRRRR